MLDLPAGWRAEIIDGELFVSKPPGWGHQATALHLAVALHEWNNRTALGHVNFGTGVIYADDDAVIPDVVWVSDERLSASLRNDRLYGHGPELVVEILSPGMANEGRDRVAKLELYGRRGATEYWLCDPIKRTIDVYRRTFSKDQLDHVAALAGDDHLESPLLPGFSSRVGALFPPELANND